MAEVNVNLQRGLNCRISPSSVAILSLFTLCFIGLQIVHREDKHVMSLFPTEPATHVIPDIAETRNFSIKSKMVTGDLEGVQDHRKRTVHDVCARTPLTTSKSEELYSIKNSYNHLLVDDAHKVMYCYVPKSGCTAWKSTLMALNTKNGRTRGWVHSVKVLKGYGIKLLSTYKPEEIMLRMKTYYKFLFVRHPLTRIVSAFRDKFTGKEDVYFVHVPKMLNFTRNLNKKVKPKDVPKYNFTFTEFLNYTYQSKDKTTILDEHWNNLDRLCSPCFINYDFIGKQETFTRDTLYLLQHVLKVNVTKVASPNWTGTNDQVARKFFDSVPKKLRKTVIDHFVRDAEMFDYDLSAYY